MNLNLFLFRVVALVTVVPVILFAVIPMAMKGETLVAALIIGSVAFSLLKYAFTKPTPGYHDEL